MVLENNKNAKVSTIELIIGLVAITISFGIIIYGYYFLYGIESINQVIIDMTHENYIISLLGLMIFPFFLGVFGGIEIGRFINQKFRKN
jgi:hypothetical protein